MTSGKIIAKIGPREVTAEMFGEAAAPGRPVGRAGHQYEQVAGLAKEFLRTNNIDPATTGSFGKRKAA